MKYYLKTYGCQMNLHDSEKIAGIFTESGYAGSEEMKQADVIVLNTCSVREKAEQKFYSELGRLKEAKKSNPKLRIAVAGCIAQQEGKSIFKKFPYVDYIFGPNNIDRLQQWIVDEQVRTSLKDNPQYHTRLLPVRREGGVRAWISIMYGCDNYCSYCVVPYTRGRERSRPIQDILNEVTQVSGEGFKEISLLGQNVNSYGNNLLEEGGFPRLLHLIHEVHGIQRIRFVTSHPKDISEELIQAISVLPKVCEHVHLPLQSGSDKILKAMNRRYTYAEYKKKVDLLRKYVPGISITTDIITGFPGETESDYLRTVYAMREIEFDGIFAFKYSRRPNTAALSMPDHVHEEKKRHRLSHVLELQDEITYNKNRALEGESVQVLVEGCSDTDRDKLTGRTRTNKIVNFYGEQNDVGKLLDIRIIEAKRHSLYGEINTDNID